jgi:NAD+ kinase
MSAPRTTDLAPAHRLLGAPRPLLRRVGLVLHPTLDVGEVVGAVAAWARRHGVTVVAAAGPRRALPPGIDPVPAASLARTSGMLLSVGGDGTMLCAMSMSAPHGTPVLGIHLGRVGCLAEVEAPFLEAALDAIAHGRYGVEERRALEVHDAVDGPAFAFNDIVLRRPPGARPAAVALSIDGEPVARCDGDGVVVATATGSTAYSLSAGGPIVSPQLTATVVTPLTPHTGLPRPLVLSAAEAVELAVPDDGSPLSVEIDGRERAGIAPGAKLRIRQSSLCVRLVRLSGLRFPMRVSRLLRA